MARLLHNKGYDDVRPLLGGFDDWLAHGYPVERHASPAVAVAAGPAAESAT